MCCGTLWEGSEELMGPVAEIFVSLIATIYKRLDSQELINQNDFVHGKSLSFLTKWPKRIIEGSVVNFVYMNFSKAFGKTKCGRLVWKVRSHGVQGKLVK